MNEKLKEFLIGFVLIISLMAMMLFVAILPSLQDRMENTFLGTSPSHFCESKGGVYRDVIFGDEKCYMGNEIYEIYYKNGRYKLAK